MAAHGLDEHTMYATFEKRVVALARQYWRKVILWQDGYDDKAVPPALVNDVTLEYWKGWDYLSSRWAQREGFQLLVAIHNYLDDNLNWMKYWENDLSRWVDDSPTGPGAAAGHSGKLLQGGEVCMWGENVNASNFMCRSWPRGAAVAERLWSPRDAGTVDEAAIRLQRLTDRMLSRKLRVSPMGVTHVDHCENFKDPYDDDPDIVSPSFYKRGADLNESIYTDMDRRR